MQTQLENKPTESRNKMTVERLKYFRHLGGGVLSVIHSRFFARRPRPLEFSMMVTSKCNCNCDFCFWKFHKDNDDMELGEIQRLVREAGQEGYLDCIFWGGEPLLRQDFAEICKTASQEVGLYTKIATNGWFLESNPEFGKYTDLSFISLDAIGEKHDNIRSMPGLYNRVESGIEYHKIHSPKMRIYICCTVSTVTDFNDIKEVAQFCKDKDILLYFTVNKSNQKFEEWEGKDHLKELEFESEALSEMFKKIKDLKKQGYPIRNSDYFMDYLIKKKNYYRCHWPHLATVMYSNGTLLRCSDRTPYLNVKGRPLKEVLRSKEFIEEANSCKNCKLACVGNYALDASGMWRFDPLALKSLMQIAIT